MLSLLTGLGTFILIFFSAVILGYTFKRNILGEQEARRGLKRLILIILIAALFFSLVKLLGKSTYMYIMYIIIGFYFIYALYVCFLLLTWQSRKEQSGTLILDVGRLSESKIIFGLCVITIALAAYHTWLTINQVSTGFTFSTHQIYSISQVIFFWVYAIYLIFLGFSRLELRQKGICYKFSFIKWHELASYKWSQHESNLLIINLKKPRSFLSRSFINLQIPFQNRDAVDRIMAEYLT